MRVEEKHDSLEIFDAAVQTWKKAQVVREGPAKIAWPAEEMIQVLAADIGRYRQRLFKCLFDDEQLVVAYALLSCLSNFSNDVKKLRSVPEASVKKWSSAHLREC